VAHQETNRPYHGRVTVAAVIVYPSAEQAIADTAGRPAVRRVVETAWAGGAMPIVVVAPNDDGRVAAALAGAPAVLAEPVPQAGGVVAQFVRGLEVALERVTETDAWLAWPGRMVWVDAETVTSLIEAHGMEREALLRPAFHAEIGWPALIPVEQRSALTGQGLATLDEFVDGLAAGGARAVDTGDPGVVLDDSVSIDQLPPFDGPPEPVAGPPPEWGSAAADEPDEGPLAGPALAPYGQAAADPD
jgi:CTP:molybdopterin cytidylyltransferase MocA